MPAAITDKLRKGAPAFSTTLAADKGVGAASATLSSSTLVPTDTAIDFTIGRVDTAGNKTPATKAVYKATLSGVTISNLTLVEGTDQLHKSGTPVEITFTAATWNDMVTWGLTEHLQSGAHGAVTATSLAVSGAASFTGAVTLPNSTITFAKLLATIFSGQVTTYTNPGTAGGTNTFFYINLGGIKLFWGNTANQTSNNSAPSYVITLPTSFFTSVQAPITGVVNPSGDVRQFVTVNSYSNTTVTMSFTAPNGAATTAASLFIIGT